MYFDPNENVWFPKYKINSSGIIFGYKSKNRSFFIKEPNKKEIYLNTENLPKIYDTHLQIFDDNTIVMISGDFIEPDTSYIAISMDFGKSWEIKRFIRKDLIEPNKGEWFSLFGITKTKNGYFTLYRLKSNDPSREGYVHIFYDPANNPIDTIRLPFYNRIIYRNQNKLISTELKGNTYYSDDNGKSWKITLDKSGSFYKPENDSLLYLFANGYDGEDYHDSIYVSYNEGKTWVAKYFNSEYIIQPIVINKQDFWGVNSFGIYHSSGIYYYNKNESKWVKKSKGIKAQSIREIAYDKSGNLYAVAYGVYKSTDNGNTWESLGLNDQQFFNILVGKNGYIYVSGNHSGDNPGGIFRSTDDGKSWEYFIEDMPYIVTDLFENKRGYIFAGAVGGGGYIFSTDFGDTWTWNETPGNSNCFVTNSEGHIFRGAYAGIVFRSTDDGDTWEQMTEYFNGDECWWDIMDIAFDPKGTKGFAICLKTTDNGRTWIQNSKLAPDACSKFDSLGNFLRKSYSSNSTYIIERSSNKGLDWENISSGLEHKDWSHLSVSPDGYYFLNAKYGGLYRSRKKYVSVYEEPKLTDNIIITPNPAGDYIEIDNSNGSPIGAIKIYNVLGVCVLTDSIHPKTISERMNIKSLPAGVYFIHIDGQKMMKFVKL